MIDEDAVNTFDYEDTIDNWLMKMQLHLIDEDLAAIYFKPITSARFKPA